MRLNQFSYIYITTLFCLGSGIAFAQEEQSQPVEKTGALGEIEVVRDYRPILADAVKIRQSPDLTNNRRYLSKLQYSIMDKKLDINTGTHQLAIQELPDTRPLSLTNNYAKIGAGNFNTILGEAFISNGADEALQVGGFVRHLSQRGDLEGQNFGEQQIGVFGRSILDQITLDGEIGYNRYATRYYGFIPAVPDFNPDPTKQHYNDLYLKGELTSNYTEDEDLFSYSVKADGYLFSNAFSAKENSFALSGHLNKKVNAFNIGVNLSGDFTSVQDEAYNIGNHIARFNPYIRFKGNNYKITLGANLVSEFGEVSRNNVFPSIDAELDVVPSYATIFGMATGDAVKTSLRDLAGVNPFLNSNIEIHNMLERLHVRGGIKGNGGATFGYKASVFYKRVSDVPFYLNNPENPTRFDVVYDRGEGNTIFGFEGELTFRVSEAFQLGGNLLYNEYSLENLAQPWFVPKLRVSANTRVNISEKVFIDGEVFFNDATRAQTTSAFNGQGALPAEASNVMVNVPSFLDASAAIEYRATKQIGIFVRANNLLGNEYQRFLYYPRLGLNVIGGVNVSF